jgi:protein required for attachment to host cells
MPKHQKLLFAIVDGEHARFVRPAADNALHVDQEMESAAVHKRSSDLGSDHPGAAFHSNSTAHHAMTPRHDPHSLEKEAFARHVAAVLNESADAGGFDELVVVAPSHTLEAIRGGLSATTAARLIGTLMKDLVKTPADALQEHLHEWVRPTHRA